MSRLPKNPPTAEEVAQQQGLDDWVSVEERLPEDMQRVLTFCPTRYRGYRRGFHTFRVCGYSGFDGYALWDGPSGGTFHWLKEGEPPHKEIHPITHWMPMPPPPIEILPPDEASK